jgi:hypothetical protein
MRPAHLEIEAAYHLKKPLDRPQLFRVPVSDREGVGKPPMEKLEGRDLQAGRNRPTNKRA